MQFYDIAIILFDRSGPADDLFPIDSGECREALLHFAEAPDLRSGIIDGWPGFLPMFREAIDEKLRALLELCRRQRLYCGDLHGH